MKPVRQIPCDSISPKLYLTFDDGPDPYSTPHILDSLDRLSVPATFFVIADRVRESPKLFERIYSKGHGIGNHSLDHRYRAFFSGKKTMLKWVKQAEDELSDHLGESTAGFRPPAGVRTPELYSALDELNIPMVLWQRRFYDTRFLWTRHRALRSLRRTRPGDIVLLHDRQERSRIPEFLATLQVYVEEAIRRGYKFCTLDRKTVLNKDNKGE